MDSLTAERPPAEAKPVKRPRRHIIAKFFAFVLTTLIIFAAALLGLMWILVNGPSPTARALFVRSVRETSAIGFLADIYLTAEEIALIEAQGMDAPPDETDASLITVAKSGGGIEITDVAGPSFRGKLMIVSDPLRVFVGVPDSFGDAGLTLSEMIENTGAVAGVNGGGFYDPGGNGSGGVPDGIVICGGELEYDRGAMENDYGKRFSVCGIDGEGVLLMGDMTGREALDAGIVWGVSYGPVLVQNGEKRSGVWSGINPRTAIGQRADGAILLLVIDGRQVYSIGATYEDVADVMLKYGAVNAYNLDGGSSTMMMYEGEVLNVCASIIGPRQLPTAILVREEAEE